MNRLSTFLLAALFAVACGGGGGDVDGEVEAEESLDGISQDGSGNSQNVAIRDCSQDVEVSGDGNQVNVTGPDCSDENGDNRDNVSEETVHEAGESEA